MKSKVLYVEDDAINALVLRKILQTEYDVSLAHNCREAVQKLQTEDFDLLITDFNLNDDLNGLELLHEIREQFPNKLLPAIALTADTDMQRELQESDFDASMIKPFEKTQMLECIESLLASTESRP